MKINLSKHIDHKFLYVHERKEKDTGAPIKFAAEAQAHIYKHRYVPPFFFQVDSGKPP